MNGRGQKRAVDTDVVCVRKKFKVDADTILEDPGGIFNNGGGGGGDLNGLEIVDSGTKITLNPETITDDFEMKAATGGGLLIDEGTGVATLDAKTELNLTAGTGDIKFIPTSGEVVVQSDLCVQDLTTAQRYDVNGFGIAAEPAFGFSLAPGNGMMLKGLSHEVALISEGTEVVEFGDAAGVNGMSLTIGNITVPVGATVDGRDLTADGAVLDNLETELGGITAAESSQIQTIDSVTITNGQWAFVGGANQNVRTSDTVAFGEVNVTGLITTSSNEIRLGSLAGSTGQGLRAVAVGEDAGKLNQGVASVAVGSNSGTNAQGTCSIAIGESAGNSGQGINSVAIGASAGMTSQSFDSVAIGRLAGTTTQGKQALAIGLVAGNNNQGDDATAFGPSAGQTNQAIAACAFGKAAGNNNQSTCAVAFGHNAGRITQGSNSVAMGFGAGETNLGVNSMAIGVDANCVAHTNSIAFGREASVDKANQLCIGSTLSDAATITEIVPGRDSFCSLGSVSKRFTDVLCTGVNTNGGLVDNVDLSTIAVGQAFGNPVNDTNMVAGTGAGALVAGTAANNVIIGKNAGAAFATGDTNNTVVGFEAAELATGINSTVVGAAAGLALTSGSSATLFGKGVAPALTTGSSNTIMGGGGGSGLVSGDKCTGIGSTTTFTAGDDHQICIGYQSVCDAGNQCTIGGSNGTSGITQLRPGFDDTCSLGSASNQFTDAFLTGHVVSAVPVAVTASSDTPSQPITRYDTTSNVISVTLPAAASNNGKTFIMALETRPGANDVNIVRAGSDTINGTTNTFSLSSVGTAWSMTAVGTNWYATGTS